MMSKPNFIGLAHVCVIVDDLMEAFSYYERILGAVPDQCIPHWKNKGFFECAGYINVPGTSFTIEIMQYYSPLGRLESIVFHANDVSGARHVALKVTNIEETFRHIKSQPDAVCKKPPQTFSAV